MEPDADFLALIAAELAVPFKDPVELGGARLSRASARLVERTLLRERRR